MAKTAKALCDRCESRITAGVSFCDRCGYPTRWASHVERTSWEVSQWKTADRSHAQKTPSKTTGRRWLPLPFARKTSEPVLALVSAPSPVAAVPQTAEPAPVAEPAVVPPRVERVVRAPKPLPVRPARSAAKPAASHPARALEPRPADGEPLRDTPATVLALRMLNARVAELDARIRQLEAELAGRSTDAERAN